MPDSAFILGQDQDIRASGFEISQALSGEIADFGYWNESLEKSMITKLSQCVSNVSTSLLSFTNNNENFMEIDLSWGIYDLEDFCKSNVFLDKFVWPRPVSNDGIENICVNKLGGRLPVPINEEQNSYIYEEMLNLFKSLQSQRSGLKSLFTYYPLSYNLGMNYNSTYDFWYDRYSGKVFNIPMYLKRKENENCLQSYENYFTPIQCDKIYAKGVCYLKQNTALTLKGMCGHNSLLSSRDNFDTKYYFYGLKNGFPYLRYAVVFLCIIV